MGIINDTLKSNGKWSRKSLTMFVSMCASVLIGGYIVVSDYIIQKAINPYAIDVFQTFMVLVGTLSGITVWDKKQKSNENRDSA